MGVLYNREKIKARDGLALIRRGDEQFVNEPHIGNAPQKLCFGGEPRANWRAEGFRCRGRDSSSHGSGLEMP